MTTIVVPLDGSTFAERALRPACSIAARLDDARVLLLTCSPDDLDDAQRRLDDRAALYSEVVDVETRVVGGGHPADTILATVATEPDAVLCMATHGRGGIASTVMGSVARKIICRSTEPLILVGPNCRTALLPAERGRLLACSDGSALSDRIVAVAAGWCERLDLDPWVTEVVPPEEQTDSTGHPVRNREVEAATKRLDELAVRLRTSTAEVGTRVLHGTPSRSIVWFAEQLPAAMIAMVTHGRGGLARIAMGSVAGEVVRHAPCPVLIARPADAEPCPDD